MTQTCMSSLSDLGGSPSSLSAAPGPRAKSQKSLLSLSRSDFKVGTRNSPIATRWSVRHPRRQVQVSQPVQGSVNSTGDRVLRESQSILADSDYLRMEHKYALLGLAFR